MQAVAGGGINIGNSSSSSQRAASCSCSSFCSLYSMYSVDRIHTSSSPLCLLALLLPSDFLAHLSYSLLLHESPPQPQPESAPDGAQGAGATADAGHRERTLVFPLSSKRLISNRITTGNEQRRQAYAGAPAHLALVLLLCSRAVDVEDAHALKDGEREPHSGGGGAGR